MPFSISIVQKYISWLKKSEGVALSDKVLIFFIKLSYISLRFALLVLGRKRRSRIIEEKGLDYGTLWNKFYCKFLKRNKMNESTLLKFKIPKYNYEFYCRNNNDDFQIMTFHEDDIIEYKFTPKEGDIVIDVGAHIGPYTLKASKHVGLDGKIIAIEADPENFNILNLNIQLNRITNVIALNYAAYSKEDKIKLYLPSKEKEEESSYTKYNTIMTERVSDEKKFVEVKANTLDYILQSNGIKHEQVNWIKIDVEGAEYEVLKGAKNILSKSDNVLLLIEIHNLSSNINLYEPIKEFLKSYNFKIDFEKVESSGERHIIAHKQRV
jgi:FkbM family methyltransferase